MSNKPAKTPKNTRDLLRYLNRMGLRVERARNGHWNVWCPDGARVQISATTSDHRSILNEKARLRRHGVVVP